MRTWYYQRWTKFYSFFHHQANIESDDIPVYGVLEDAWMSCKGPTPLVELAIDQRPTNYVLVCHHYYLATVMYAVFKYGLKSVKPLSLYDSKVIDLLY